jgi:hypothetical protein
MTKTEALNMIDAHKDKLVDPVQMLHWTWLRVIINQISDDDWEKYVESAVVILSG